MMTLQDQLRQLKPYDHNEACPKCGAIGFHAIYQGGIDVAASLNQSHREHLECTCWKCGWMTLRACLDTPERLSPDKT